MAWSIAEVAQMSRVTSRTLRHYDSIGLLKPAFIGSNGYRYYEEGELLRLQRILVLRELGVGLGSIAEALGAESDPLSALRSHRRRLIAEQDRIATLIETVERTMADLDRPHEGGADMATTRINRPENLFDGFDPSAYEAEAAERWPEQFEQSKQASAGFTPEQLEVEQREMTARMIRMAELMVAGVPADAPAAQDEVDWHFRSVARLWTPDAAAYTHMGQMYVDDERFRSNYEQIADGLAEYQRDAMAAYARERLD